MARSGLLRAGFVLVVGASLVVGATRAPDELRVSASAATAAAAAARTGPVGEASLTCPSSPYAGADGVDDLDVPGAVAAATAPTAVLGGARLPNRAGELAIGPLGERAASAESVTERGTTTTQPYAGADPLTARATASLAPGLTAYQEWTGDAEAVRGLGGLPCTRPVAEAWLLAGGGDPGRQERLVLTNTGANPVTVDVTLHGRGGAVESASGDGLVVPPRSRVGFLVDAISSNEQSPAVRVVARGGLVHAALVDTWLDGTRAAGTDAVPAAAPPAERQVVAGVAIDGASRLRILTPGDDEAVVQARAVTKDGRVALGSGGVVRVPGGSVRELDLAGLPKGVLGIEVESDLPVVVAAVVERPGEGGSLSDYAWATAAPTVAKAVGLALPDVAGDRTRRLSLVATGAEVTADVVVVDAGGEVSTEPLTVPADTATTVDLPDGAQSVWVRRSGSGDGVLYAALVTESGSGATRFVTVSPLPELLVTRRSSAVQPLSD